MTHKKTDEGYQIFRSYLEEENDKPYYSMNTLSFYYEDMERKQKLIEDLAKAIAGYDQTLTNNLEAIEQQVAERFEQWDEKLKAFDGSVIELLQEWVNDGTLDHIVDSSIVDQKLAPLTAQVADAANEIDMMASVQVHIKKYEHLVSNDDWTDAFNTAINDLANSSGGTITGASNAIYGIAGEVKLKSNVTLDLNGGTLKRIGTEKNIKIVRNANYGSSTVLDKNMVVKNLTLEGTGNTNGTTDQGGGLAFFVADGVLIENVKTKNTNGDGIQWRKADNITIRNVEIGDFGRNGISPTSGLNAVWDNVRIAGVPLPGANPGKDIDAETNKPSTEEKGTNFANNIQCRNITLVDFFTPDGGEFSQEWMFNNCIIGEGYNALNIKSTNKTIAKNVVITSNCTITASGSGGAAIRIENVSGVKIASPTLRNGTATGSTKGIGIAGTVDNLDVQGVDTTGFTYGIQSFSTNRLTNSNIKNSKLGNVYLGGIGNKVTNSEIGDLIINGADSVDNVFDVATKIGSIASADSGSITAQHFGEVRGTRSKSFYSIQERVPSGTSFDLTIPLPVSTGSNNGRSFLVFAGYSYLGRADHSATLLVSITTGDTTNAVSQEISKSGSKDISVLSISPTSITLRLTYQFAGNFSATVIG